MKKRLIVGIDWFGPYSREEARKARDWGGGLYLAIGKLSGTGVHARRPQYLGISKDDVCGRCSSAAHHKLRLLDDDFVLWLGEVSTAEPSGKKRHATPTSLRYSEWLYVFFMDLQLNVYKKTPPPGPVTVLNRWWKTDYATPRFQRPHPDWPDLLDFAGPDFRARKVWFGGRQVSRPPADWR